MQTPAEDFALGNLRDDQQSNECSKLAGKNTKAPMANWA
jgi:hypothetical protein